MTEENKPKPPIEQTAYHEAGHAVVAVHLGLHVNRVTIRPGDDYIGVVEQLGIMMYEYQDRRKLNEILRCCIFCSLAGFEAEKKFEPNADRFFSEDDIVSTRQLLIDHGYFVKGADMADDEKADAYLERRDAVYDAYLEQCRSEARRLVVKLWPKITMVTEELLRREELTGEEVEALMK